MSLSNDVVNIKKLFEDNNLFKPASQEDKEGRNLNFDIIKAKVMADATHCPYCGDSELFPEGIDAEGPYEKTDMSCGECGEMWRITTKIINVERI